MAKIKPRTSFDFEILEKGTYRVKISDTGVDAQKKGKTSGRRFWVRLVAVGGDQEGISHIEGYYEKKNDGTENTVALSGLAGLLVSVGILKGTEEIDTVMFSTSEFAEGWLKNMKGRELGIKINHKFDSDDKNKETPRS